jgi:hypothetical protein
MIAQRLAIDRNSSIAPTVAAGGESRLWEIGDIVKVVEEWEAANAN